MRLSRPSEVDARLITDGDVFVLGGYPAPIAKCEQDYIDTETGECLNLPKLQIVLLVSLKLTDRTLH